VLCEGTTEKLYFSDMEKTLSRQPMRDVDILKAKETDPNKILQEAIRRQLKEKNEMKAYEEVWIVFDDDNRRDLKSVFEKAKLNCISIAYSSISFEYWYFLHFKRKATVFNDANEAKNEVGKHIPGYYETMPGIYNVINDKYNQNALSNTEWLQNQKGYSDMYSAYLHKPITNVNELCKIIINFGK